MKQGIRGSDFDRVTLRMTLLPICYLQVQFFQMSKVYIIYMYVYKKKESKWPKVSVFSSIYSANFDNVLNI